MGYSERHCQFCATSFNIARVRRLDEPDFHAWNCYGEQEYSKNAPSYCDSQGCHRRDDGEHLAGPRCMTTLGYRGNVIDYSEMVGCNRVQCLEKKEHGWEPEPGDEDYDISSQLCFTTGISQCCPYMFDVIELSPVKHGIQEIWMCNSKDFCGEADFAIPFHPWCFEIFKQHSMAQFGFINLDGLWKLRHIKGERLIGFEDLMRSEAMHNCVREYWEHKRGSEFLVASPVNIPELPSYLPRFYRSQVDVQLPNATKLSQMKPVSQSASTQTNTYSSSDPFSGLAAEVLHLIIENLTYTEYSLLCRALSGVLELPPYLVRRYILEEHPYFWEAKTMPTGDLDIASLIHYLHDDVPSVSEYAPRPTKDFNYRSYSERRMILKGLVNRKRIWYDVQEIVRMIAELGESEELDREYARACRP